MHHLKKGNNLSRTASHRKAMLRNIVTDLFRHGKLTTTTAKAKELVRFAEKLITLAKKGDLHSRRQVLSYVKSQDVGKKLFEIVAPRFQNRNGGYTRILKVGQRIGDGAEIALVELVE
ncbi:MAG: 50S ribosomal protein L17 [Nitrospirota bacterium]